MNIVIAGGSGEVGNEVLKLLARSEHHVFALVRKTSSIRVKANHVSEVLFDFDFENYFESLAALKPDIVICALGTTLRKAGSVARFNQVDHDYPVRLIEATKKANPHAQFILVSSVGAERPRGVYLKAKFLVEAALKESGLKYIIVRPSLLMSERKEFRLGEVIAQKIFAKPYLCLAEKLAPKVEQIWKFAPIEVSQVAKIMIKNLSSERSRILEGLELR